MNLTGIIFDGMETATLRIGHALYGPARMVRLKVTVSPKGVIRTLITRNFCILLLSKDVSVRVRRTGIQSKPIRFKIKKTSILQPCNFVIEFGDGTGRRILNFSLSSHILWKIYNSTGKLIFKWTCYDKRKVSLGRDTILIIYYEPIIESERYFFPTTITLSWPRRTVRFYVTSKCTSKPPSDAMYRINFDDGSEKASWSRVPFYSCGSAVDLPTYTYNKSGCYNVHFQMKNLLGVRSEYSTVSINQIVPTFWLRFSNFPSYKSSNKTNGTSRVIFLQDKHPFLVEAVLNASTCFKYEWTIVSPYWRRSTSNVNKIVISHLLNKGGVYNLIVRVHGKRKSMLKPKRFVLLRPLRDLALLSTDPNYKRQVDLYLLVKEPGISPMLTWDFGDGQIIKEESLTFATATSLPNVRNVPGANKLNIATYKGIYKEYKYKSNGLFNVLVTVSDNFRELIAKKTVFISNTACSRPSLNIFLEKGSGSFRFSLAETFTIQTYVEVDCIESSHSSFKWEMFTSSRKDMENEDIAESDRKIE